MPIAICILPSPYYDSVTQMLVARGMLAMPGLQDAAVVMGTPANLAPMRCAWGQTRARPSSPPGPGLRWPAATYRW